MQYKKFIIIVVFVSLMMLFCLNTNAEKETTEYGEAYRNHLAYSAKQGWNNDPNGLLYVPNADGKGGVYHMYYQYNWDQVTNKTDNVWGKMSWGHATSEDLVNWKEQPVAIPAIPTGKYNDKDEEIYAMMFSGSAVYDEHNTSGLFEMEEGILKEGHGIVAILTQPTATEGLQRQILAYSYDGGKSFQIYGEILSGDNEGGLGDNEFRDPKVFWSEDHKKWLMVVGGGAVRMYASTNLKEWEYLGQTGLWGECPDLSCYEIDGKTKYALILSPEDKANSHKFNETTRNETFYPAEYYTVGELNKEGLFMASQPLKRLSEGLDSYAFQSFNNSPDGKVYGISWSACWKNVDSYKDFKKTHNGGLTIACEMNLIKNSSGYALTRMPVSQLEDLRKEEPFEYDDILSKDINGFSKINMDIADIELEFDFSTSEADLIQLELRKSIAEQIKITYCKSKKELVFDRSESSLLAINTPYYNWKNTLHNVDLKENKLALRIVLDRAFISVFVNGGEQSLFAAVFPSAISKKMSLKTDADIQVKSTIWDMKSIYGEVTPLNETIYSTHKLDIKVNEMQKIVVSSFAKDIDVLYAVEEGEDVIELYQDGNVALVKGLKQGTAKILANDEIIDIYVYHSGFVSDVSYSSSLYGYSYYTDKGLVLDYDKDAFLFSDQRVEQFIYSASIDVGQEGQAAGLLFGLSDNFHDYVVATVDFKDNLVKLWRAGIGDLKVADYNFNGSKNCNLTVSVENKTVKIYVNDDQFPIIYYLLEDYMGGKLGLNVYHSSTIFNHISLDILKAYEYEGTGTIDFPAEGGVIQKVVNITDNSYRLSEEDYIYEEGILKISEKYLKTLKSDTYYTLRIITESKSKDIVIIPSFDEAKLTIEKTEYTKNDSIYFSLEEGQTIQTLYLDGKVINEYTIENNTVTLSENLTKDLVNGSHTITVYTSKGRPSIKFSIVEVYSNGQEETATANHIFFFVDISLFASLILGYIAFTVYKKRKKMNGGKNHE